MQKWLLYAVLCAMTGTPFALSQVAAANHLASTPPMGWNSWNKFGMKIDDATVRAEADALVSSGMKAAGYEYVNIDEGWEGQRDAQGNLMPNAGFPDMKALADYVHSKGLKIGIYSSPDPSPVAAQREVMGMRSRMQSSSLRGAWII